MHAAARHPGIVDHLVLISANVTKDLPAMLDVFERRGGPEARAAAERYWKAPDADSLAAYIEWCVPLYTVGAEVVGGPPGRAVMNREVMRHYIAASSSLDLRSSAASVQRPTLVLVGEDDPVTPASGAELIASLIPDGLVRLERFADCGHGTHRDQSQATEQAIRSFLDDSGS
jgi:proline iminopeptidase